jgi:hypothetical protein
MPLRVILPGPVVPTFWLPTSICSPAWYLQPVVNSSYLLHHSCFRPPHAWWLPLPPASGGLFTALGGDWLSSCPVLYIWCWEDHVPSLICDCLVVSLLRIPYLIVINIILIISSNPGFQTFPPMTWGLQGPQNSVVIPTPSSQELRPSTIIFHCYWIHSIWIPKHQSKSTKSPNIIDCITIELCLAAAHSSLTEIINMQVRKLGCFDSTL